MTDLPGKRMGAAALITDEQGRLPAEELRGWAWSTEQQAGERLSELLARRIAAAVQARAEGTSLYLEDGVLVT